MSNRSIIMINSDTPNQDKHHLHLMISQELYHDLKSFALKYGSIAKVIEDALLLLKIRDHEIQGLHKAKLNSLQIWDLMRSDFNMMAVGRRTFLSYIDKLPTTPLKDNNALELIEWFYENTPVQNLSLKQILSAIKDLWLAGNYFRQINIEEIPPNSPTLSQIFKVIFHHDFNERKYGEYWAIYFKTLLESDSLQFSVQSVDIRNQFFYLFVSDKKK